VAVAVESDALIDFDELLLPSLLQTDNLPWLAKSGFPVLMTVYAPADDAQRVYAIARKHFAENSRSEGVELRVEGVHLAAEARLEALRGHCFERETLEGHKEGAAVTIARPGSFWGNGTLRNLAVYCRKPGVSAGGLTVRVRSLNFRRLLERYRERFGDAPIPNARLVDMAFVAGSTDIEASNTDMDSNASYSTGTSWRSLSDDLIALVEHAPSVLMFWPNPSDIDFFRIYATSNVATFDVVWPEKLMAERRWRVMASTDLAFVVEATAEHDEPVRVPESGRRFNEAASLVLPHRQMQQMCVITVRRHPFSAESP